MQELLKKQGKGGYLLKLSIAWLCLLLSPINKRPEAKRSQPKPPANVLSSLENLNPA